ncbi:recombinase family protein [Streptomyces sp. NPDC005551]|uniref:recombinase family protein n=1 Tax=Streptomyces sp. NPDC005551 TaxID=3364725 RepID=UPI0036B321B5
MAKALIYVRHRSSVIRELQEKLCRNWCERHGHTVVRVRQEAGTATALELAHGELEAEQLDFGLIVAWRSDRYDRDTSRLFSLIQQARERSVPLFTADDLELTKAPEGISRGD